MRPIDADALQDKLDWDNDIERWTLYWINDLDEMPTLDVEPVRRGRWLDMQDDDMTEGLWRCSACGDDRFFYEGTPLDHGANYCPSCGAKMEKL